jgi:hypothetical protein
MGKAGIVLGLEVARNSTDWHRLLEICALTDTLIFDEDGVYDPSHFNDRLLRGQKGTLSEAELHVLRARLQGGILNKARRGELQCSLPVGLVYNAEGRPALDPDKQVQESLRLFFETFPTCRLCMRRRQGLSSTRSALSTAVEERAAQRGPAVGGPRTQPRARNLAQSPLCRRVCLRPALTFERRSMVVSLLRKCQWTNGWRSRCACLVYIVGEIQRQPAAPA